jgi:hypothetical protein
MLDKLIGPVAGLLGKFIQDKDQANALAYEISTLASKQALEINKAQLAVNAVEAAHKSATSYWHDLTRCRWFAEELTIQGTIRRYDTPVLAYCKPMYVNPAEVVIYD